VFLKCLTLKLVLKLFSSVQNLSAPNFCVFLRAGKVQISYAIINMGRNIMMSFSPYGKSFLNDAILYQCAY
jgi:hypothetical protein